MALLMAIVLGYSVLFHVLMAREGQHHSWLTGLYWTLQTMSTLGYGDIAFTSDLGRMYSLLVLATGITILFIFLPFTLIQFFYAPWLESRAASRAPVWRKCRPHVLCVSGTPMSRSLAPPCSTG